MSLRRKYNNFLDLIHAIGIKAIVIYFFLYVCKLITKFIRFIFKKIVRLDYGNQQVVLEFWNEGLEDKHKTTLEWRELKKVCDRIIADNSVVIGCQSYDLSDSAVWFYDPVSKTYIDNYDDYIDGLENDFDLRIVWELNRLQFLLPLAQASKITGDRIYVDYALKILNNWIFQNGYESGSNWIDAQESGIRLVNVLLFKEIVERMGCKILLPKYFVFYHLNFLVSKISINRVTHNHFFTESCSLYASLLLLNPSSFSFISFFMAEVICLEVNKQLDSSGFSYEGSSNYTLFVYDALALVSALEIDRNTIRLSKKISYENLALCCDAFDLRNGDIVKIGDADCGRYVKVNWLADLSRPLERKLFKSFVNKYNEGLHYLDSLFMNQIVNVKADKQIYSDYQNNRAGLFISTKNSKKIVIQSGATQRSNHVSIGHSHSDLMSFMYFIDGQIILIDPGTYLYMNGLNQRHTLRAAKRHNCVLVDNQEYIEQGKSFFGITNLALVRKFEVKKRNEYIDVFCEIAIEKNHVIKRYFRISSNLSSLIVETTGKIDGEHSINEYINLYKKVKYLSNTEAVMELSSTKQLKINFLTSNFDNEKKKSLSHYRSKVTGKTIAWASRYGCLCRGYQLERELLFNDFFSLSTEIILEEINVKK